MKLAGVFALCLTVGWVGGYQHKRFKVKAAEATTEERIFSKRLTALPQDLQDIKSLSERLEPRLRGETNQLRIAELLRNMLYTRIPFYGEPDVSVERYEWLRVADTFRKSILDPGYGHMCGGRTIVYLAALRAFGLTARKVGLYSDITNLPEIPNSHASVEVLIDEKWIAQDPTFNISLHDKNGRDIGWLEAADLISKKMPVTHSTDGFDIIKGRSIDEYEKETGVDLDDITNFWNTSPYLIYGKTQPPLKSDNWDGILRYRNGSEFDVFDSDANSIYKLLAEPV